MSIETAKERKKDAHEKIQLGGLAVMAGLRDEDKNLVLGALLSLRQALDTREEATLRHYRELGSTAFRVKQTEQNSQ